MKVQIRSDGRTVWVNSPEQLLGRFSRMGIDVHVDGACAGDGCKPGPCTVEHWDTFKREMLRVHQINVSDRYIPKYLKECR